MEMNMSANYDLLQLTGYFSHITFHEFKMQRQVCAITTAALLQPAFGIKANKIETHVIMAPSGKGLSDSGKKQEGLTPRSITRGNLSGTVSSRKTSTLKGTPRSTPKGDKITASVEYILADRLHGGDLCPSLQGALRSLISIR